MCFQDLESNQQDRNTVYGSMRSPTDAGMGNIHRAGGLLGILPELEDETSKISRVLVLAET